MDQQILKAKKVGELREIAKAFGISGCEKMKKAELLEALAAPAAETIPESQAAEEAPAPEKRRRGRPRKNPLPETAEVPVEPAPAEELPAFEEKPEEALPAEILFVYGSSDILATQNPESLRHQVPP